MAKWMGKAAKTARSFILQYVMRTHGVVLWVPLSTFILGSWLSLYLYMDIGKKEEEVNRSSSLQRAQNSINKIDLMISNSLLRIQSYEDYLGSRWINYKKESHFLKNALQYTIFERLSVFQRNQRWKPGMSREHKFIRLLRVEADSTSLPKTSGLYMGSAEVLSAVNEMQETGDYQRALLYTRMETSRLTVILKARSRNNIFFVYTVPLEKLFEKAEIRQGETIRLTDLQSGLQWRMTKEKDKIHARPETETRKLASLSPTYTFLFAEGLPQSGLKVGIDFDLESIDDKVSAAAITGSLTLLLTILVSYLFWVLIAQNKMVSRVVVEKTTDLEKARHEAREALLGKTRFIGNISHEIRTPLNLILGMIDLCEEKDPEKKIQDYLANMRTSGNHLLAMIEDLLDLARSESNEIHVQMKTFNLSQFLDEIARIGGQECAKKGLRMYANFADDLPTLVVSDPSRLRQILLNLLKNACKYTNEGFVALKVTSQDIGTPGSRRVRFEFRDSGIGIPKDKIGRIFEAFFQLDSTQVLAEGGVGLGLSIVRELVRKLKGKIDVRSTPGRGSVFHVDLNLETPDESPWLHRYKSADEKSRDLVLLSGDQIWSECVMSLSNHPNLNVLPLHPSELNAFLSSTSGHLDEWIICDLESSRLSLEEFRKKMGSRKYVVVGNKKEIFDRFGEPPFPVVEACPTVLSDILVAVGLTSRKRQRPSTESEARLPSPAGKELLKENISIVIADDDVGNRELYRAYFENAKWKIDYTENGQVAWEAYLNRKPDLLILDVRMPVLDGFGVIEKVRQHEEKNGLPRTPVILVTADALEQTAERARGITNVTLLTKPIRKSKLLETMNHAHTEGRAG